MEFLQNCVLLFAGVQFIDRCLLFFMPSKHQPDYVYLRHVPLPKVYLFTFFQAVGLAMLWVIKSMKPVSIIFPMMVSDDFFEFEKVRYFLNVHARIQITVT